MPSWVRATICWMPPEAGGRTTPPLGPTYSTAARFDRLRERWPSEGWSIVAELVGPMDERRCVEARVRLLNPDGPEELLSPGSQFDLFEGAKRVGRATVTGPEP